MPALPGRRVSPAPATTRKRRKPLTGKRTTAAAKMARVGAAMAEGWEQLAECVIRGLDPELFFPENGQPIDARVFGACGACQVRRECLDRAMSAERTGMWRNGKPDRHGIYGGLTPRQRSA